jgi:probable phosphoglycerate mutase
VSDGYRQLRFAPPPGSASILLVRHGESAAARPDEPFDLVDGHGDPELHPAGREQAERVAERLAGEPIRAVYVSTLRRTAETAAPLATRLGLTPIVEPDLREVFLGEWEGGRYRRHAAEGHPVAKAVLVEERWDVIPGAEPADAFAARTRAAIGRIALRHPDELVVAFTHGGVIGSVLAQATRSRPFAFVGSDNASISHLVAVGEEWVLRGFNDTGHLGTVFAPAPQPPT